MIAEVRLVFLDDASNVLWGYTHAESVAPSEDGEALALRALGVITTHAKAGAEKITEEATTAIERSKKS